MSTLNYVVGDATQPVGDGEKVIVHCCNDEGRWGAGFVLAVSYRWRSPEKEYRLWHKGNVDFVLGAVQFVWVQPGITVANLIGQRGVRIGPGGEPPVRYDAIEAGLQIVAEWAKNSDATVHMPRIGCGLAGGRWDKIEPIIKKRLVDSDVPVTVYDLPAATS